MKAPITFTIGLCVAVLSAVQLIVEGSPVRVVGLAVGLFFVFFGWLVGWTRYRRITVVLGHLALVIGCLVTAYAIYQLPAMREAPSLLKVLDLPLFWGLFTACGGYCMITHGYCSCCTRMHVAAKAGGTKSIADADAGGG